MRHGENMIKYKIDITIYSTKNELNKAITASNNPNLILEKIKNNNYFCSTPEFVCKKQPAEKLKNHIKKYRKLLSSLNAGEIYANIIILNDKNQLNSEFYFSHDLIELLNKYKIQINMAIDN